MPRYTVCWEEQDASHLDEGDAVGFEGQLTGDWLPVVGSFFDMVFDDPEGGCDLCMTFEVSAITTTVSKTGTTGACVILTDSLGDVNPSHPSATEHLEKLGFEVYRKRSPVAADPIPS